MQILRTRLFSIAPKAAGLVASLLLFIACQELSAEKPMQPIRPVDTVKSTATASAPTDSEVGLQHNVTVRLLDKAGNGIYNLQPSLSVVTIPGGSPAPGVTSSGCSATDTKGIAICRVSSVVPGTFRLKVTSPSSFLSNTIVFTQKPYALAFSAVPTCTTCRAGLDPVTATVKIVDRVGADITTDNTSQITIALTNPAGAVTTPSPIGAVTVVAGVATFTNAFTVNKSGSYTLTANLGTLQSGVSSSFTINPGPAHHIAFITQPSTPTPSRTAFATQPSVGIYDVNNNLVTGQNCNIAITKASGSPSGSLLGTANKPTVNGIADFTGNALRIDATTAASGYRLQAASSGVGCPAPPTLGIAVSDPFAISLSGLPYQLAVMTPPGTAALSEVWNTQPVIQVLDIDGNPVSTDNQSVVTIAINQYPRAAPPALPSLLGALSIPVTNGLARFSGLSIDSTQLIDQGDYEYVFTGNFPGITLQPAYATQTITPDGQNTPFRLEFFVQPISAARGQTLASFKVRKVDNNGFLNFTENSAVITLTETLGPGTIASGTTAVTMAGGIASFDDIVINGGTGNHRFHVTDGGTPALTADSSTFSISAFGLASRLEFPAANIINSTAPTGTNPWVNYPIVHILDDAGNLVGNDNTTVVKLGLALYASPDGSDVNLVGTTSRKASGGIVNFPGLRTNILNVTNITLEATSTPELLPAQSASFNGNTAAVTAMRFVNQPAGAVKSGSAGRCYVSNSTSGISAITVAVVDANNNIVTSDNGRNITITASAGNASGTLSASTINGVASFGGIFIDQNVLSATLSAISGGLTTVVSNTFGTPPSCPL